MPDASRPPGDLMLDNPMQYLNDLSPTEWPMTQTGLTPYLVVDQDSSTTPNVFEQSFGGQDLTTLLSNSDLPIAGRKHDRSPGAARQVVQSALLKRPKLPNPEHSSSISIQSSGVVSTESSGDSPPSDKDYSKTSHDSDAEAAFVQRRQQSTQSLQLMLPHAPNAPSTINSTLPASKNVAVHPAMSSQDYASIMRGYANGAQAFQRQTAPKPVVMNRSRVSISATMPTTLSAPLARQPSTQVQVPYQQAADVAPSQVNANSASAALKKVQQQQQQLTSEKCLVEADAGGDDDVALPNASLRKGNGQVSSRRKSESTTNTPQNAPALPNALPIVQAKSPEMSGDMDVDPDQPQEGKRAQFLERNRVAACKSRQKKKEWVKSLESTAEELGRRNDELQQVVKSQQEEIAYLHNILTMHEGCECANNGGSCSNEANSASMTATKQTFSPTTAAPAATPMQAMRRNSVASPTMSIAEPMSAMSTMSSFADQMAEASLREHRLGDVPEHSGFTPNMMPYNLAQHQLGAQFDYFSATDAQSQPFSTPELAKTLGFD